MRTNEAYKLMERLSDGEYDGPLGGLVDLVAKFATADERLADLARSIREVRVPGRPLGPRYA